MRSALALALVLTLACSTSQPAQKPKASAPRTQAPSPSPTPSPVAVLPPGPLHFSVDAVATGIEVPWSLAFRSGGRILVSDDRRTMPAHLVAHLHAGHHSPGVFILHRHRTIPGVIDALVLYD